MAPLIQRYKRLLGPLLAAIVAGAVVAGVSLATDSAPSGTTASNTIASSKTAGQPAPTAALALQSTFVKVVQSVSPSVVQIEDQTGLGSGVVLDSAGDIVTNNHVVTGAKSLTVTTSSGKRYPAKLVGSLPRRRPRRDQGLRSPPEAGDLRRLLQTPGRRPRNRDRQPPRPAIKRHRRDHQRLPPGRPRRKRQRHPARPSSRPAPRSTPATPAARSSTSRATSSASPPSPPPTPNSAAAAHPASASPSPATSSRTSPARSSPTAKSSTPTAPTSASAPATQTATG